MTHCHPAGHSRRPGLAPFAFFARRFVTAFVVALSIASISSLAAADGGIKKSYDIPAGVAEKSLKEFSNQSGSEVLFPSRTVGQTQTNAVSGEYTAQEALDQLLKGTGLVAGQDKKTGAMTVSSDPNGSRVARNPDRVRPAQPTTGRASQEDGVMKLDTFEVMDSKLLNMDKPRSRDDAQPYVIFNRESIRNSGAANLEDFLKQRLSMNAQGQTFSQLNTNNGNMSQINLRGIGVGQTLILVDGHRVAGAAPAGAPQQGDLNGIPLAAIERIEVLPTTASGIYGGSATGGVVNVILRRDYAGVEVKFSYENAFKSDMSTTRTDLSAGFNLEKGKTNLLLTLSRTESTGLAMQDRSFLPEGRQRTLANNPGAILNASTPPLGRTTNIRSSTGAPLTLKTGAALNSPITFVPVGYAGLVADGGAAFVANAGKYNLDSPQTAQTAGGGRQSLLSAPTVESAMITLRRQFSSRLQVFVEASAFNNTSSFQINNLTGTYAIPFNAANNPFNQNITVTTPTYGADGLIVSSSYDRRLVAGAIVQLPLSWTAETDYTYDRTRFAASQVGTAAATGSTAVANGTLDVLRDTAGTNLFGPYVGPTQIYSPTYTLLQDFTFRSAGPAGHLPGGDIAAAFLFEHRSEDLSDELLSLGAVQLYVPSRAQAINSGYAEFNVPVIGPAQAAGWLQGVTLQLAVRRDEYAVTGSNTFTLQAPVPVVRARNKLVSTDPTIGVKIEATPDLTFRASYGTGFLPPTVNQLAPNTPVTSSGSALGLVDPRRGNEVPGSVAYLTGGSPTLQPEYSETVSAGFVLTPREVPGLHISLDWSKIHKRDNITTLTAASILANEALLPGRVTRAMAGPGDPNGVGMVTGIDATFVNIATADIEAYDVALDYVRNDIAGGKFSFSAAATWQPHFKTQILPAVASIENAGSGNVSTMTFALPIKFKANSAISWEKKGWLVVFNSRYFDSYFVSNPTIAANAATLQSQGNGGRVQSQIYHDLFLSYHWKGDAHAGSFATLLRETEIRVGIKNLFNISPPFDASMRTIGYYSPLGEPGLARYSISISKHF